MKSKYVYIIAYVLVLLFLFEIISFNEICKRKQQQISALTTQNATLQQDIADMQSTVAIITANNESLTAENAQLKAQQTKVPEAQKTNRSVERPRYNLADAERDLIERVVMAESGGESYEGQILVCQCILNACEIDGIRPAEAVKKYVYAKARPEPSDSVKEVVEAVFDKGETVTDEPIVYFYAPAVVRSKFHERQRFVVEEGNHKFFAAR